MKSGSFSSYRAALSGTGADIGGERDDEPAPVQAPRASNWPPDLREAALEVLVGPRDLPALLKLRAAVRGEACALCGCPLGDEPMPIHTACADREAAAAD